MRTFRRKLVITPLLMAMALMALGLPASAQAVYQQNSSQACCEAQACCATQSEDAPDQGAGQACCPGEQPAAAQAEYCPAAGADQSQCTAECEAECVGQLCVPAQGSCPGPQSAPGCCP